MTDYQKYINALRKCAKEHEGDKTFTGQIIVSNLCRDVADLLEEVEQEPKTGHWIKTGYIDKVMCSICNRKMWNFWEVNDFDYCPKCGVKMIKEGE